MRTIVSIAALVLCSHCVVGRAQNAAYVSASLPVMYVEEFQPVAQSSGGFGPLHAIGSGMRAHRVDSNAAALSRAVVKALANAHVAAEAIPTDGPIPKSGWLIRGVFFSLDDGGHLLKIPFLSTNKAPNVEVTVTIADCAKDPNTPFAVIGTDSVLQGQGAPLGWNPYVVSARFVIHRIEGDHSLDGVAGDIAQKILEHRSSLVNQDESQ
jgi:hypothetical protein